LYHGEVFEEGVVGFFLVDFEEAEEGFEVVEEAAEPGYQVGFVVGHVVGGVVS
jgi:hypothetical protein